MCKSSSKQFANKYVHVSCDTNLFFFACSSHEIRRCHAFPKNNLLIFLYHPKVFQLTLKCHLSVVGFYTEPVTDKQKSRLILNTSLILLEVRFHRQAGDVLKLRREAGSRVHPSECVCGLGIPLMRFRSVPLFHQWNSSIFLPLSFDKSSRIIHWYGPDNEGGVEG